MRSFAAVALSLMLAGCSESLENPLDLAPSGASVIADRAVVTADANAKRLSVLVPGAEGRLARTYLPLASPVDSMTASADGARVFVITTGLEKTRTAQAVVPELIVISVAGSSVVDARYPIPAGVGRITLDPEGTYAALWSSSARSSGLVSNPDVLAIVKLDAPASSANPVVRSLARQASITNPLVFSPALTTPRGVKRFLVGIGPRDVAMIDLAAAFSGSPSPEVKVPTTSAGATTALVPSLVRFDDGDPGASDDARVAFALAGEGSILTATIAANDAPAAGESDLRTIVNLTDVGAPVSDLDFLVTAEGRRIAALTPAKRRAVLADPVTSLTTPVPLARPYDALRVLPGATASTVLLSQTGGSTGAVALWDVPKTAEQPYRAVEAVVDVDRLDAVRPIPGSSTKFLVTAASGSRVVVLDVATRETRVAQVSGSSTVLLARDGARAYVVPTYGAVTFVSLPLQTLVPSPFSAGAPAGIVGELRRADGSPLVAVVHGTSSESLSLFDPLRPESLGVRFDDLLTEGVRR